MKVDISVLLPTRGRTTLLEESIMSLLDLAAHPDRIEILLMFDDDDQQAFDWFQDNLAPQIDKTGSNFRVWQTPRLGYEYLHKYVNFLAGQAQAPWLVFWNDDAKMLTKHWDKEITAVDGFYVLRMPTHNEHPYAIFPILPMEWYNLFGYLSCHQLSDAWISQIAYLLDIVKNIPVKVLHDRHDLTGNNKDDTFEERVILEGKPNDPRDFNHEDQRRLRFNDAAKLAKWLEEQGRDMSWFTNVSAGKQNPWDKMTSPEYDPNRQLVVYKR